MDAESKRADEALHVALYSPAWGTGTEPNGVVTYVRWMRDALSRRGHRVSVFTGTATSQDHGVHIIPGVVPGRLTRWWKGRAVPGWQPALGYGRSLGRAMAELHRYDAIDVIEMEESFGWAGDVANRLDVPVIAKLHGPAFMSLVEEELQTPYAAVKIEREGRALARVAAITSPAQSTLEQTIKRYRLAPKIARHVVNPMTLPPGTPLWSRRAQDAGTICFVGRFDKRKGGDTVLLAFRELLASDPRLMLHFVGSDRGVDDGAGRRTLSEWRDALFPGHLASRVHVHGPQPGHVVAATRAASALTVIASRWENQSYTALEAMMQGCPLVSSSAGGHEELVRDGITGLKAAPGDAHGLAAAMRRLLEAPDDAASMGRRARDYALAMHSPDVVVDRTLDVYREAIRSFGRNAALPVRSG